MTSHFEANPNALFVVVVVTEKPLLRLGCSCRGTLEYAHELCIQEWIAQKRSQICELCRRPYSANFRLHLTSGSEHSSLTAVDSSYQLQSVWNHLEGVGIPHFRFTFLSVVTCVLSAPAAGESHAGMGLLQSHLVRSHPGSSYLHVTVSRCADVTRARLPRRLPSQGD